MKRTRTGSVFLRYLETKKQMKLIGKQVPLRPGGTPSKNCLMVELSVFALLSTISPSVSGLEKQRPGLELAGSVALHRPQVSTVGSKHYSSSCDSHECLLCAVLCLPRSKFQCLLWGKQMLRAGIPGSASCGDLNRSTPNSAP